MESTQAKFRELAAALLTNAGRWTYGEGPEDPRGRNEVDESCVTDGEIMVFVNDSDKIEISTVEGSILGLLPLDESVDDVISRLGQIITL